MNTQLQQLIDQLKLEKLEAHDCSKKYYYDDKESVAFYDGKEAAYNFCIQELTKILNEGFVAAPPKDGIEDWVQDGGHDASF